MATFQYVKPTEEQKVLMQGFRDKFEKLAEEIKEALDDWTKAGKTLIKNRFENTGNEMIENVGYIKGIFSQLKGEKK